MLRLDKKNRIRLKLNMEKKIAKKEHKQNNGKGILKGKNQVLKRIEKTGVKEVNRKTKKKTKFSKYT